MARQADIQYIRYFTDGSAAPQMSPVVREDPYYVPKIRKRKKKPLYVDPVASVGILVAVGLVVSMFAGLWHLNKAQQQTQNMEQYVAGLNQENDRLTEEYKNGYDLQIVERTALALGMVPAEDAPTVPLSVEEPIQEQPAEEPTVWQKINMFLAGLFA